MREDQIRGFLRWMHLKMFADFNPTSRVYTTYGGCTDMPLCLFNITFEFISRSIVCFCFKLVKLVCIDNLHLYANCSSTPIRSRVNVSRLGIGLRLRCCNWYMLIGCKPTSSGIITVTSTKERCLNSRHYYQADGKGVYKHGDKCNWLLKVYTQTTFLQYVHI